MVDLSEILKTVLSLEIEERAAVAEKLLQSLENLSEAESERVWGLEAQRRLDAYRAGLANFVPASDVAKKAEKLFQ